MSHAADESMRAAQADAWRELEVWHAANVLREAFKRGEPEAVQLIEELKEPKE